MSMSGQMENTYIDYVASVLADCTTCLTHCDAEVARSSAWMFRSPALGNCVLAVRIVRYSTERAALIHLCAFSAPSRDVRMTASACNACARRTNVWRCKTVMVERCAERNVGGQCELHEWYLSRRVHIDASPPCLCTHNREAGMIARRSNHSSHRQSSPYRLHKVAPVYAFDKKRADM